jgi:phosphate starvation-inducible PhoH-like protein
MVGQLLAVLDEGAAEAEASVMLKALSHEHFFWAEIQEIEEGESDVYDLTVPGSHAFCANGFVNHNTYLAMAMAVEHLIKGEVSRIILTRPAVEAGERLGYLPGDLAEKINPYLRPLYDALFDMMEVDMVQRYIDRGIIEVAPLAFMRGRTLNDSFIILDEAQNTTAEQMKMFLTRLGFDAKAVVTGDVTQIDLPSDRASGLIQVQSLLANVPGIKFNMFSGQDVVRHELVQAIIEAYEKGNGAAGRGHGSG